MSELQTGTEKREEMEAIIIELREQSVGEMEVVLRVGLPLDPRCVDELIEAVKPWHDLLGKTIEVRAIQER